MNNLILADVNTGSGLDSFAKTTRIFAVDTMVVFLIGTVICGALVLWARYLRNRRRRVTGGEKVYRSSSHSAPSAEEGEMRRRYKRRVRRRDHRVRNPTLSEVGGLPPARTQEPADPS